MGAPSRICLEIVRTGTRCTTGAARGSDYCQRHRAKREPGDRVAASPTLPAKRPNAPITLAEPTMVNPTANGHGRATASGLDELILTFESNLATLRAAKALLEIHG